MSHTLNFRRLAVAVWLGLCPALALASSGYVTSGGEYAVAGSIPGDQVHPQSAVNTTGGFVVWQDNNTDGDGWGVSAQRLDGNFSPVFSPFPVNVTAAGDQENPQVSLLKGGGAVFVWQGGQQSFQRIFARFLAANGTWSTGEIKVNTFTNDYQIDPVVTTLANSNVLVAWSSFNEAASGSLQDVYFQLLSPSGQKIGGETQANLFTAYNQRSAAVAALGNGNFVVTWVSEQQQGLNRVDIYARVFTGAGTPLGKEMLVNASTNLCANPSVAGAADGSFVIAWGERDATSLSTNSWDVYARPYANSSGTVPGTVVRVNTTTYGDQYAPKISYDGANYLVAWTSLGQDGSREGVFAQVMRPDGSFAGSEFLVNTTTAGQQIHPAVSSDGAGRFLTVWSGFLGGLASFDLYAQRYASLTSILQPLSAPVVSPLSSNTLSVAWAAQPGYNVSYYEIYADGAATATATTTNNWYKMPGLMPSSTHAFTVDYVLTDGRRSPISASGSGTTWSGLSWGGIPYEWMTQYFGTNTNSWPAATADSDADGVSNLNEFLAGTVPTNAASVLRTAMRSTSQGLLLSWNTQPGLVYQAQVSTNVGTWANLGAARFAAGTNDTMNVGGGNQGFYRVLRVR